MSDAVWYCPICQAEGAEGDVVFCGNDGSRVRPIAERGSDWVGKVLADRYRVLRFIDAGGTADVYEAERIGTGRRVALKLLHAEHDEVPGASESFQREAELVSLIAHPNVVAILDFGTIASGKYYMVMELLEGRSIAKHLESGALPVGLALKYAMQACEGLAAAHARDVLHCDVKPANFILHQPAGAEPVLKILDLGIGRMLGRGNDASGLVSGTPEYMSPEQARGLPLQPASDIYSMGVTVWEMLLGELPFEHESYAEVLKMQVYATPEWPAERAARRGVPPEARDVLMKALEKDPARRHGSMLDLQLELASLARRIRARSLSDPALVLSGRSATPTLTQPSRAVHRSAAVPRIAPAAIHVSPLERATGLDDEVVEIARDVHWVGRRRHQRLEHNAFLVVLRGDDDESCSVLVDPGPPEDLPVVMRKVASVIGSIDRLDFVFLGQHDADVSGSAPGVMQAAPNAQVVCSDDTFRLARLLGLDGGRFVPVESFPNGLWLLPTGHFLYCVPAPFCPTRGAVMLFDPTSRVLFSGAVFGGAFAPGLVANDAAEPGIEILHQLLMPSGRALSAAIDRVVQLDPQPTIVAPRHGGVLLGDHVALVVELVRRLEVGPDRASSEEERRHVDAANALAREYAETTARDLFAEVDADRSLPRLFSLDADGRIGGFEVTPRLALDALVQDAVASLPAERHEDFRRSVLHIRQQHGLEPPPDRPTGASASSSASRSTCS